MSEKIHFGIDLGTTNTVVAKCRPNRNGVTLNPIIAQINQCLYSKQLGLSPNLPSVLFCDYDDNILVGEYAKHMKDKGESNRILYNTKIDMGKTIEYDNSMCINTPVKAAAEILKVCYDAIKLYMPKDEDFPKVTITVPASFSQNAINDTLEAAKIAGFDKEKITILEEPLAALYCYINGQRISGDEEIIDFSSRKRVLVYDIGGGTCDVCIVDLEIREDNSTSVEFIETNRYTEFGGNDFDEAAAAGLLNKLFKKYSIPESSVDKNTKKYYISKILPFCEVYKKFYSQQLKVKDRDDVENAQYGSLDSFLNESNVELELSFDEYEESTRIFFDNRYAKPSRDLTNKMRDKHVIKPVYEMIQKLENKNQDKIDCVLLTGGMSEYGPIEEALYNFCKVPVIKVTEPMQAVAKGAAMSVFFDTKKQKNNSINIISEPPEKNITVDGVEKEIVVNRPKLAESIFVDLENHLPYKIIDSEICIPCESEISTTFKVKSCGVRVKLFAGESEYDPEMRSLYDQVITFDHAVKPNTQVTLRYEINDNRLLKIYIKLHDDRNQEYELTCESDF